MIMLAKRMGVPKALGLTVEEWVNNRLGGYVKLSISDRREAVAELTKPPDQGGEGLSQREAAEVLGVNEKSVRRDVAANAAPTDPPTSENAIDDAANAAEPEIVDAEIVDDLDLPPYQPEDINPNSMSQTQIVARFAKINDLMQPLLRQVPLGGVCVDADIFFNRVEQLAAKGWRK